MRACACVRVRVCVCVGGVKEERGTSCGIKSRSSECFF